MKCDGDFNYFSSMKILEYLFDNIDNYDLKCWFNHPITTEKVFFIPDSCHTVKLAQNTLVIIKYRFLMKELLNGVTLISCLKLKINYHSNSIIN